MSLSRIQQGFLVAKVVVIFCFKNPAVAAIRRPFADPASNESVNAEELKEEARQMGHTDWRSQLCAVARAQEQATREPSLRPQPPQGGQSGRAENPGACLAPRQERRLVSA
jgi:hypothetical protein